MKLGALVYLRSGCSEPIEIASINTCELEDSGWKLRISGSSVPSKPTRMKNGWTRFDYFNIMTAGIATREIHWPHAANSWLPQANYVFSSLNISSNYERYRIVDGIEYRLSFRNTSEVSPEDGYLFLCPLANFHAPGSTRFTHPNLAAYWSLDPSGTRRLNHWRATMLGFPSVEFKMKVWTRTWDENVYVGLQQFHRGKGFDPNTRDVARHMGIVLYESPWIDDQLEDVVQDEYIAKQASQSGRTNLISEGEVIGYSSLKSPELEIFDVSCIPDRAIMEPEPPKPLFTIMRIFTRTRAQHIVLLFGLLFVTLFFRGSVFNFSDSNIVGVAIQRAETLESWLPDEALITLIDVLKADVRAAVVYNAIEGEGIRRKWVRRQLSMKEA
ncbi:hypothetical protein MVEN_02556400 [Mycena venus]|uniref:Uncharacterized protein n=1 Tax=Mycena venus TaxID=2733690 RepID=A0A8H6U3W1_9AGAR|nr:hypothetical protein MVEN_02556400 [Mycena venus]